MSELGVTILGSGPSGGVPLIGCECATCQSKNIKNNRLRASIHVKNEDTSILIDTSPDLRSQALRAGIRTVDAILYTHAHADHIHGLDDARAFNYHSAKAMPVYSDAETICELQRRFDYAFGAATLKGAWVKPVLTPNIIEMGRSFNVGSLWILPVLQYHGKGKSIGYRIGNFAYSTDVDKFANESLQLLEKLDVWLVDCLQYDPAPTHAHLAKTLEWIEKIKPKRAILTHMTHVIEYEELKAKLPAHIEPAYDGMTLTIAM